MVQADNHLDAVRFRTDTLLPMAVFDDVVGIVVFFWWTLISQAGFQAARYRFI